MKGAQRSTQGTVVLTRAIDAERPVKNPAIGNVMVIPDEEHHELPNGSESKDNSMQPLMMNKDPEVKLQQEEQAQGVEGNACMEAAQSISSKDLSTTQNKFEVNAELDTGEEEEEEEDDELSSELSSELSRLDVSESDDEQSRLDADDNADAEKEANEDQLEATSSTTCTSRIVSSTPQDVIDISAESKYHSPPRLQFPHRMFDSDLTSQLETDATQPDEQFLGDSVADSQATDPVMPIRLSLSMSSVYTDTLEPAGTSREQFTTENLSEEPDDDDVALVKSPSAGRGLYARSQASQINNRTFGLSHAEGTVTPVRGELKRQFESILEEERAAGRTGHERTFTVDSPIPQRPVHYDDGLRSRLLSQPIRHQIMPQHPPALDSLNHRSIYRQPQMQPQMFDVSSSPLSFDGYHTSSPTPMPPPPSRYPANTYPLYNTAMVSQEHIQHQYDWNTRFGGVQYNLGYSVPQSAHRSIYDSPSNQKIRRRNYHQEQRDQVHPPPRSMMAPPVPHFQPNPPPPINGHFSSNSVVPTTPSGYMSSLPHSFAPSHGHFEGHSLESNYYGSGYMSPSQSPSQRMLCRTQPAVMSYAEQEQERCIQHYHGNHLPEPAGGKKLKSSPDHGEEFIEYGEDCTVYLE